MAYLEDMKEITSITDSLAIFRNKSIRNILNIVEVSELSDSAKKKIREIVLDEINGYYNYTIKVLTYIQEDGAKNKP